MVILGLNPVTTTDQLNPEVSEQLSKKQRDDRNQETKTQVKPHTGKTRKGDLAQGENDRGYDSRCNRSNPVCVIASHVLIVLSAYDVEPLRNPGKVICGTREPAIHRPLTANQTTHHGPLQRLLERTPTAAAN
jgi:hypothetical protein